MTSKQIEIVCTGCQGAGKISNYTTGRTRVCGRCQGEKVETISEREFIHEQCKQSLREKNYDKVQHYARILRG